MPGRFVVNRIIRPRLSCAACETITQASMPPGPIAKSYAGPGLLTSIIVNYMLTTFHFTARVRSWRVKGLILSRTGGIVVIMIQ